MDTAQARAIARAFLPQTRLGNRRNYFYTRGKLASDPLYPGVLDALRGDLHPLLDLGCGLGLLAHTLRGDNQQQPYHGVDIDPGKLESATRASRRAGLHGVAFTAHDLAAGLPEHRGSVALLDVLHYLPAQAQRQLLAGVMAMLPAGGRLVIRTPLADRSARDRTTRLTDLLAHLVGWMGPQPRHYPRAAELREQLHGAGLSTGLAPLYGNTPFNNWLIVAQRR
ncbi:methyltransferase [Stenotrophomonas sp. YIM B06876]|uniref:methyltransferase n=1 Tax=Stenotrophomonas sp. YIM B06876 TaxID=3060211 RepID=UPI0027390662|nr:methyltransferase [Stenotrophomonas sp. YIM B06876]